MKSISAKKLKKLGGKMPFSSITAPKKAIPKSNPRQQAKRKAGYRKLLSGKEYKAARIEAMARAGGQCECLAGGFHSTATFENWQQRYGDTWQGYTRCSATENLHAHHKSYPKSRPLEASDLTICCKPHHEYLESLKPHKQRMF